MVTAILFISFIILLLISVPIGIALGLASLITILLVDPISMETFSQSMVQGLNSFPLIAVPLFAFAGDIMGKGGVSKRLLDLIGIVFGRFTGGLGIVSIITCLFFAAISGTGSATVAAVGCIMLPSMFEKKYDKVFSSSMIATAGTVGVIIPPSICMVVYAVAAGVSVTGLFTAGIIPGLVIGLALVIYTVFRSKKENYVGEKRTYTAKEVRRIVFEAIPALLVPVIILGGIYGGLFTPTEAAAAAVVYGIFVSVFVYKEVRIKELPHIMFSSVYMCATVLIIIGISAGFGRILTITQAPVQIANAILSITSSKVLILILINVLLMIVGTFMETNSAIIILTPILLPIITQIGVNPIHFGVIMVLNLAIGFITPPLGANLFMACQVGNIKFDDICKGIVPWIIVMIIVLMIITFIPEISLALPRMMNIPIN
ncbi:MAG: TRAP transporter large permease [Eubacterium sp.]|nr:TRAP transporter large permease [Eubacterium sp.]